MQKTRDKGNHAGEPSNCLIRNIKRKRDSLTMEAVEKLFGQPMDEASNSLGVSWSTLKRFSRDHSIPRWATLKLRNRSACVTDSYQHFPALKNIVYLELLYVGASPWLCRADFIDDQGSSLKMAGCSSGFVHDYLMEPDGIANPMEEIGRGLEGAWPPPIGSADMSLFGANPWKCTQNNSCLVAFKWRRRRQFSTTVGARGRFLSKPSLHVYHVAKLIVRLRYWKKRSLLRMAMAHQDDSLVLENTANTEQATNNVDPLMARTAMAHQNNPVVFDGTTYMEQATNNVEPLMDVDLD